MSYNYWISCHQHTHFSNNSYFEVVTKPEDYIKYAEENNLPAVCITEHGGVQGWIKKKELVDAAGLKFIDGIEAYVTMNLKQGNIYVTTACLAGAVAQNLPEHSENKDRSEEKQLVLEKWLQLAINYPDNVFLEVQPHHDKEQIRLNHSLQNYATTYGLKLIAANDIHSLNPEHDRLRKIIKKGKKNRYDDDDKFELWCKSRSEMFEAFQEQGVLTDKEINDALDLTVEIANSVESFELDKSHKYPQLYTDPDKEFQKRIKQGLVDRGVDKLPKDERKIYIDRVNREYKVYKHNGAINYMLSHQDILNAAKAHGVRFGYSRGSVSGSLIAYLCGQTEMDSVKFNLNFGRFMNPSRISLADIDTDMWKPEQQWTQQWILQNPKWHAASIMTANTYGLKAAIKAIADGMERYEGRPAYIQSIRNQIAEDGFIPEALYEEHQQLIDDAKKVVGVIDSFGRHAAGIVIDTNTIDDAMGTQTISGWDYPVTQVAMKEIDHVNWVKYDVLGLDNIGLISRTAELAGIPFPTPDSDFIDFNDEKVWKSMRNNNIGIFQFEGDRAGKILRSLFSKETLQNIKDKVPNVKYMDLLSLANGAMRPSGAGFIDAVTHGKFKDNGHPALNEFLAPTLGYLVYQEQLMEFLVKFCGFSEPESDLVRRGIGKKDKRIMDEEVPKIKPNFVKTMINVYQDTQEHAEKIADDFIQVFMDAANYGFSINHSMAYSYIGYISTWLRYYYPLEWCTAAFQIWKGKQDKLNKVVRFAESQRITLKPFKFRKSKSDYYIMDIYDNSQIEVKNVGDSSKDGTYEIKELYNTFTEDELKEIDKLVKNNSLSPIKQESPARVQPVDKYDVGKSQKYHECLEYEKSLDDDNFPLITTLQNEYDLLGRCLTTNSNIPSNYAFITSLVVRSNKVVVGLYSIKHGKEIKAFISKRLYNSSSIAKGDLIKVGDTSARPKTIMQDGKWVKSRTDKDLWIDGFEHVNKAN